MTTQTATSTETDSQSWFSNVRIYWKVSALGLAAVALLGIIVNAIGGNYAFVPNIEAMTSILVFDWTHNIVHVALFGIAAYFGFTNVSKAAAANAAKIVGVVYLALGVLGFIPAVTDLLLATIGLSLQAGENILHLALGAWGAYVGFTS